LTIAAHLVTLMGGGTWVESEPGAGSTFHFTLPLTVRPSPAVGAIAAVAALPAPLAPPPEVSGPAAQPHPMRVLLAEDNPVNQKILLKVLEKKGHSVVLARNGKEAVEASEQEGFDFALMDVQMP